VGETQGKAERIRFKVGNKDVGRVSPSMIGKDHPRLSSDSGMMIGRGFSGGKWGPAIRENEMEKIKRQSDIDHEEM